MLLTLCLLAFMDQAWKVEGTEVYQPLRASEVLLGPDGRVYVLNFDDAHIKLYNADGSFARQIGRKGKGPGEFTYATGFFMVDNKLYVQDVLATAVSVYTLDGEFVRRIRMPNRDVDLAPIKGGWVYGSFQEYAVSEAGMGVYRADIEFKETKKIIDVTDPGFGQGLSVSITDGEGIARYSPLSARPTLRVSPDGTKVYLADAERFKVQIYDVASGKLTKLDHKEKRIPLDEDWVDERVADLKEDMDPLPNGVKFEVYKPDFFPQIRSFRILPDGTLAFDRWRGRPDKNNHPIGFSPEGKVVDLPFEWKTLSRLAGVHDGYAYITMFVEGDEEGWLTRVPVKDADQFVKDNPDDPEAERSRSISISD